MYWAVDLKLEAGGESLEDKLKSKQQRTSCGASTVSIDKLA